MSVYAENIPGTVVYIRYNNQTTVYSVDLSVTVESFKETVAGHLKVPPSSLRFIFGGKLLEDSKTLSEYGLEDESTINLVVRGGGGRSKSRSKRSKSRSRKSRSRKSRSSRR